MEKNSKERNSNQRKDIKLNLEIANAIKKRVFSGLRLYQKEGFAVTCMNPQNGPEQLKISQGTLNSWITRGNVIPETGERFKDFIDRARADYRIEKKNKNRTKLIELAEAKIRRVLNMRTSVALRNSQGEQILDQKTGAPIRKENVALLRVQCEVSKYVLERLDQDFNKKDSSIKFNKKFLFSLADLRRSAQN